MDSFIGSRHCRMKVGNGLNGPSISEKMRVMYVEWDGNEDGI
jgi:hypothetical protein